MHTCIQAGVQVNNIKTISISETIRKYVRWRSLKLEPQAKHRSGIHYKTIKRFENMGL